MALEPLEVNLPMIHQAVLDHQQMSGSEMCVCVRVCVGGEGREAGRRDSLQRRREAFGGGGGEWPGLIGGETGNPCRGL